MKKITFVEKDDNSSYDPVNTFFSKTKASSVAKPSANTSKQASSIKTPIQKSIQTKKQKANHLQKSKQSIPQKIGLKGGSGYIPKKIPGLGSTSSDNLKEQTIYYLKQKQSESTKYEQGFGEKANLTNKKFQTEKKPDMVFDIPKANLQNESQKQIEYNQREPSDFGSEKDKQSNINKLPQIKSPSINQKAIGQGSKFQKPQVPKFENNTQKGPKPTLKDKYFQKSEDNVENQEEKGSSSEIKVRIQQQIGKKIVQIPRQKPPSSLQKPKSSKQINNQPAIKNHEGQQGHQQYSQQKQKSTNNIQQRIKELQLFEKEYQSKIQYLQQRIQTLTKVQQKYNKVVKQHKLCQEKSRDLTQMCKQLQEAKQSIQKFLSQPKVPYSKKRQYLLLNQINQLKKSNRQLVLRIKNYKGSDLMEMAISKSNQEISRQFQIDYQQPYNKMNTQIQSNLSTFINNVYEYLEIKSGKNKKTTKEEMTFDKEQRFLLELNSIAEKISLTYLEKYEVSPLPKYNHQCMNLYAQIEKQRSNILNHLKINQLTDKEELNFAITENNLQIINHLHQNISEINSLQQKLLSHLKSDQKQKQSNRPGTSYGAQNKNNNKILLKKISLILQLFKKRSSISTAFHVQSICYFTFMKETIEKKLRKLQRELVNLFARIKEMKDIFDLGGNTAKQSLYLYLETHLQNFTLIIPNLQCDIKQIKSTYNEISRGIDRKIQIHRL